MTYTPPLPLRAELEIILLGSVHTAEIQVVCDLLTNIFSHLAPHFSAPTALRPTPGTTPFYFLPNTWPYISVLVQELSTILQVTDSSGCQGVSAHATSILPTSMNATYEWMLLNYACVMPATNDT